VTAGNIFSNPGPVIFGNVAVMVALVAAAAAAALWRRRELASHAGQRLGVPDHGRDQGMTTAP
jgi:hypothetical protein